MSLTPQSRSAEATSVAMNEGLMNGLMTLIPSTGAVYLAMKNSPRFLARTNMQSRTALAIMPALFVFAWTAVSNDMTFVCLARACLRLCPFQFQSEISPGTPTAHDYRKRR